MVVVAKVVVRDQGHGRERETDLPRETEPPPARPLPAVTVRAPWFWRRVLPIVVVETSFPVLSVPRSADVRAVR